MLLYLVRHGDALGESEDPERSLSPRGQTEVRKIARHLESLNIELDYVYHSGKTRAEQTAEIIGSQLTVNYGIHRKNGLKPMDSVEEIASEIQSANRNMMFVGHLPFLDKLASFLLTGQTDTGRFNFFPASALCLKSLGNRKWTLLWMFHPDTV